MPKPADPRHDRSTSAVPHAGDLAVAGAIPATFVATPAIAAGGGDPAHSATTKPATPDSASSDQAHDVAVAYAAAGSGGLVAPAVTLASAPAVVAVLAPSPAPDAPTHIGHSAMIAPFVPIPHGAGAPDTVAMGQATSAPLPDLAVPDQTAPETVQAVAATPAAIDAAALDAVRTSVATLQESLAALAGRLPDATAAVQPTLDAAQALVTQTLDGVQDQIGETIAAVTTTVEQATDGVVAQINEAVGTVGGAATALTASVLGHAAVASDTVAGLTAQAGETVAAVAQPMTALLDEGFAGHDPAGGITTLVSMVSAADAFGLHDAAAGAGEALTPALGALGAADLLADVAPVDALLGVSDHHDSHGLADLDGLFGHG